MRGHIERRGKGWTVLIDAPRDPITGKRRQKRISAPTKREVEVLAAAFIASVERGEFADAGRLSVREYLDQWLAGVEQKLRPSTHRRYSDLMRKHVVPVVGNVKLDKLSPLQVQRLYADRLDAGLSPTTVHQIHNILHRSLKQAIRWGLLTRNPTESVDAPRPVNPECKTWNAEQTAAVLAVAEDDDLEALWRLALMCGLRRGELLGLQWQDIDLAQRTLAVRRTLSRGKGGVWVLGEPKTARGRRSIALPASCIESLRRHRTRQLEHRLKLGDLWHDHGFVFTNGTGGPLHVNSLVNRFRRLIISVGVPPIRFHDLRHTCATLHLAGSAHPKVVQELLGHSDVGITLNRYIHVSPHMQRHAAEMIDALLSKERKAAS